MGERFEQHAPGISFESARYLQDLMQRVPEAVNRLCQQIVDLNIDQEIKKNDIALALRLMDRGTLEKNASGYWVSDPLLAAYLQYYR